MTEVRAEVSVNLRWRWVISSGLDVDELEVEENISLVENEMGCPNERTRSWISSGNLLPFSEPSTTTPQ